jgi:hypothetical protein
MLWGGGEMITITKTFYDGEFVEDFIKNYFKEFHPAGYSTSVDKLTAEPIFENGQFKWIKYEVTLSRFESCD